ncbi:cytochrome P450 6A1-like [Ooceraea biroi]|uniref:cytochrome P450 6A1-like n=1 Tax=Ooceraea biroi TaxID=2015173 RepID=UPI0009716FFB|nr:cytochrome P450 6A1-like [Ooceraea biroi]XP_026828142.1 cytochrome P450 6A1-like [Ooceraea biroi]
MALLEALCGVVIFLFLLYRYLTATFDFWKKRGVPGPDPVLFFGTMKDIILEKVYAGIHWKRMYDTYEDSKFVGLFNMRKPVLLLKDPKHIRDVCITDGSLFSTRGLPFYPNAEPLIQFLFFVDGSVACPLRAKMSPMFTPSKLKEIFFTMQGAFSRLEIYMDSLLSKNEYINCSDVTSRFTADIISSSLLGINANTLSTDPNEQTRNKFIDNLLIIRSEGIVHKLLDMTKALLPELYNLIGYRLFRIDRVTDFYTDYILELMEYRKKHGIVKCDIVGLLMEIRDNPEDVAEVIDITDHFFGAQLFGFFTAAFDTSALTIANTLYELALNQNIQDKLRDEIRNMYIEKGELTYDNINSMSYLNAVLKESGRKYPLQDALTRSSTSSYTFRDTNITVPKDQAVIIPVYAIHHDPKIYPNPEVFDPERFNEEAIRSRDSVLHLPFGCGVRKCLGERLGALQSKMGVIAFLRKYKLEVCEKTVTSYKYNKVSLISIPDEPLYFKVTKIDLFCDVRATNE